MLLFKVLEFLFRYKDLASSGILFLADGRLQVLYQLEHRNNVLLIFGCKFGNEQNERNQNTFSRVIKKAF